MVALVFATAIGIFRGRNWAGWTALAIMLLVIVFKPKSKDPPPQDAAELREDELADAGAKCLLLLTALPLFTPAANRFFAGKAR